MYVLDKLWHGDSSPIERSVRQDGEYKQLLHRAVISDQALRDGLSPDGKRSLEELVDLNNRMSVLSEQDMFIYGFQLGARVILDVMDDQRPEFMEVRG